MAPPPQKDGAGPEDKPPQPDWAEIYTDLLCHTSENSSTIPNLTIPQITAIRAKLGKHIPINIGFPGLFAETEETNNPPTPPSRPDKPPKLSEFMNFANMFNGI